MEKMTFWEHLEELRGRLLMIIITVLVFFVFFFAFGLDTIDVGGLDIVYPYPTIDDPISAQFFQRIQADLVPETVNGQEIQVYAGLTGGMVTLFYVSLFLAVTFAMPMIVYQLWAFLAPGLFAHEKRLMAKMLVPAVVLFAIGCLFAYLLILPFIIEFLIDYIFAIGGQPLIRVEELISFILLFTLSFGIIFELPIIMAGITRLGVIQPKFWKENWRWAFIGSLLFGGIITPDGSGITQLMVAIPMMILYGIGYVVSLKMRKG